MCVSCGTLQHQRRTKLKCTNHPPASTMCSSAICTVCLKYHFNNFGGLRVLFSLPPKCFFARFLLPKQPSPSTTETHPRTQPPCTAAEQYIQQHRYVSTFMQFVAVRTVLGFPCFLRSPATTGTEQARPREHLSTPPARRVWAAAPGRSPKTPRMAAGGPVALGAGASGNISRGSVHHPSVVLKIPIDTTSTSV